MRIGRPVLWTSRDLVDDGVPLLAVGAVDHVRRVDADEDAVGRDGDHVELVDLVELVRLGHGGAGHARELLVHAEEVLERDRGEGLRLLLDLHAVAGVLGLDGLVQPVGPLPALHEPARELVDDDDGEAALLLVADDGVALVALVQVVRLHRVVDEVRPLHVARRVEALDLGQFLGLADALVGQVDGVLLLLDLEVAARLLLLEVRELDGDLVRLVVAAHVGERRPGDDERRAGLVDEDVIHLVDDGVIQRQALHLLVVRVVIVVAAAGGLHVVAEVVEAELGVGAVGDVAVVGLAAGDGVHVGLDVAGGDAEGAVDGEHPFAVAAGEVVVDGDDVDALALEGVEVRRERGDERLAFAGDHLGDVAAVQDDAADHLHVEVAHVLGALGGLAAGGERLGQEVVELRAGGEPLAELGGDAAQVVVGERLHGVLERR